MEHFSEKCGLKLGKSECLETDIFRMGSSLWPCKHEDKLLLLVLLSAAWIHMAPLDSKIDYTGHKVIRIYPRNETHLILLDQLEEDQKNGIDFWSEPVGNRTIDLHIPPTAVDHILDTVAEAGMKYEILIQDIQKLIDHESDPYQLEEVGEFFHLPMQEAPFHSRLRRSAPLFSEEYEGSGDYDEEYLLEDPEAELFKYSPMGKYARYDEIDTWLRYLPNYKPDITQVLDIGYSFEGRNLKVIKIGSQAPDKPAIWIDAGMHAREWIAPATAVCLVQYLLSLYGKDPQVTTLVNTFDWYIMPMSNPDGYEYSHTKDRMWRKTRSFTYSTYNTWCRGVDANRNFDFEWLAHCKSNLFGRCRSGNPCSSTFAGKQPFSEMETIAIANFLLRRRPNLKMYFSLHSYSQLWLTPWSHSSKTPKDDAVMMRMAQASVEALSAVYNTTYTTGSPARIIYTAGGTSYDWAKAVAGIKYSYTIELRDKGKYGFLLPQKYIVPVCEETFEGIKVAALRLLDELEIS